MRNTNMCSACCAEAKVLKSVLISCSFVLVCGSVALGDLVNGDFSAGSSGWSFVGSVTFPGGVAVMHEVPLGGWDATSLLKQAFTIPPESRSLSFEYKAAFEAGGNETFLASFSYHPPHPEGDYDADGQPDNVDPDDDGDGLQDMVDPTPLGPVSLTYFTDDSVLGAAWSSTGVTVESTGSGWTRIGLDLTDLNLPLDASRAFELQSCDSSRNSTIMVDNVSAVVPLPGAALLGILGLSAAGWRLQSKSPWAYT